MLQRALALVLASMLPACSFVFVHGPEVGVEQCTASPALPALDGVAALAAFGGVAYAGMKINEHARGDGQISTPIAAASLLLTAGVFYAVSAVGGLKDTAACRAKKRAVR